MTKQPKTEHLPFFVYGTLLPGHHNYQRFFDKIKPTSEVRATLDRHVLIGTRHSGFPYMADELDLPSHLRDFDRLVVPSVTGVLLRFRKKDFPTILQSLDYLEGVPDHYDRKIVNVYVDKRTTVRAWTYYAPKDLVHALLPYPFIVNGDWDAHVKAIEKKEHDSYRK